MVKEKQDPVPKAICSICIKKGYRCNLDSDGHCYDCRQFMSYGERMIVNKLNTLIDLLSGSETIVEN